MSLKWVRKLDEQSLKHLKDGEGPCDMCICGILRQPLDTSCKATMKRCVGGFLGKKERDEDSAKEAKGKKGKKRGKTPPPGKKGAKGGKGGKDSKGGKGGKGKGGKGYSNCPKS